VFARGKKPAEILLRSTEKKRFSLRKTDRLKEGGKKRSSSRKGGGSPGREVNAKRRTRLEREVVNFLLGGRKKKLIWKLKGREKAADKVVDQGTIRGKTE